MRLATNWTYQRRSETGAVDKPSEPTQIMPSMQLRLPAGSAQRRARATSIATGTMVSILALITGCSSSTTPSATTSAPTSAATSAVASSSRASDPAGKGQVCAARDQLKTSVAALTDASLLTSGTTGINAAVAQVQTDLAAVKTAGKQTYATEVDAMQSAVDQLKKAAGDLGNGNAAENLQSVGTAIASTGVAAEGLFTKLAATCGS